MAPRLRTKPERLIVAGLIALALLALGEQAPAAFPVHVSIEGRGANVRVSVDGQTHILSSPLGGGWQSVTLEQPGPLTREYQVDGSDTTSTNDREPALIRGLVGTPLYRLAAWLRDEDSYSRWENLRVSDLTGVRSVADARSSAVSEVGSGQNVADARSSVVTGQNVAELRPLIFTELGSGQRESEAEPLPAEFRLDVDLRRPEALARVWLVAGPDRREGLELDRDKRNARWMVQRGGGLEALPRWFFPEQAAPFAAELLWLVGRTAMVAFGLGVAGMALGRLVRGATPRLRQHSLREEASASARARSRREEASPSGPARSLRAGASPSAPAHSLREGASPSAPAHSLREGASASAQARSLREEASPSAGDRSTQAGGAALASAARIDDKAFAARARAEGPWAEAAVFGGGVACWLLAAALVCVREYHQLPHILDGVSYTFQAAQFAAGQLSLPAPPLVDQFKGPFEVLWQGRVFSQYPPGAPAIYAIGKALSLEWLVGPLLCAILVAATALTARMLFGLGTALATLGLGVISPFVLFQAGSYLSHPVAGGLLAAALAAFVLGECRASTRWYALCGALLGAAFVAREVASVLFAIPLGVRLLASRRWSALSRVVAFGLPFVLAYLVYDLRQTGSPLLLPRMIFDASDHFGFGDGVGFHTRHTLAAGLANTDELLTILQFDLFGWVPLVTLGVLAVPFLFGRARTWDVLALGGFLAFVVAYVGYFYHGIALGPRYYFEAVPWLLLLGGRAIAVIADLARSRVAALVVVGGLTLNTFLFYLPAELARRQDFSGLPLATPLVLSFVESTLFGPQLIGVPDGSLVVTSDWWIYNAALAPLNCARMPNCAALFVYAPSADDVTRLEANYPGRTLLRVLNANGRVTLEPY